MQRIRFTCQYPKLKLIDGLDAVRAQLELFRTLVRQNALSPNDPVWAMGVINGLYKVAEDAR